MSPIPCTPAADYRTDAPRVDGWTYERQAAFLMTLSETGLVSQACAFAEMSVASAYALRREPRGVTFALGWQAAYPDPLGPQIAAHESSLRAERSNPVALAGLDCFASLAMTAYETVPQFVEKSATFSNSAVPVPCGCHDDRELVLLEAA